MKNSTTHPTSKKEQTSKTRQEPLWMTADKKPRRKEQALLHTASHTATSHDLACWLLWLWCSSWLLCTTPTMHH
jgi:hypothetical protein